MDNPEIKTNTPTKPNRAELKAKARAMYFEHYPVSLIAKTVGLSETIIKRYIHGSGKENPTRLWVNQRRERERDLAESLIEDNSHQIQKLFRVSLPIIVEAVMERHKDSKVTDPKTGRARKPISISEAKALTDILSDLDHLVRLAAKDPGDQGNHPPREALPAGNPLAGGSMEAIRKAIHEDKFLDVEPIKQGKHKSSLNAEERRELFKKPDELLYGEDEPQPAIAQREPAASSGQPAFAGLPAWGTESDAEHGLPGAWEDAEP